MANNFLDKISNFFNPKKQKVLRSINSSIGELESLVEEESAYLSIQKLDESNSSSNNPNHIKATNNLLKLKENLDIIKNSLDEIEKIVK